MTSHNINTHTRAACACACVAKISRNHDDDGRLAHYNITRCKQLRSTGAALSQPVSVYACVGFVGINNERMTAKRQPQQRRSKAAYWLVTERRTGFPDIHDW